MHPTPRRFIQAILMIASEFVMEARDAGGEGEPYEAYDQIDGLGKLTQSFGDYMASRVWSDIYDNPLLTNKALIPALKLLIEGLEEDTET